jgi:phage/plasmid-associated DNA primase
MPESSRRAANEWRLMNNPLAAFIEECCDVAAGLEARGNELYEAWTCWSAEHGRRPTSVAQFYDRVCVMPTITSDTYQQGVHKMSVFRGIALKEWATRKFTVRQAG